MNIGIVCYPSVGGSGILATGLGEELAARGHEVHFISYERPFRLPMNVPRLSFHEVGVSEYGLFKYPDYTLPLSVRMAEVSRDFKLDVLHVHYAVPHATAAILARSMLPPEQQPKIITTLHGTDTTLLGRDADYGPAIRHALLNSDAVTTVSDFLKKETRRLLSFDHPIEVIHNFFSPKPTKRTSQELRSELGIGDKLVILHSSNLRPVKRIPLLLEAVARIRARDAFKLIILAGESFEPHAATVEKLGLRDRVLVIERVKDIEDYLQMADLILQTSDTESFCLSILEGMFFGCPCVARRVGGIPEVVEHGVTGTLVDSDNPDELARAVDELIENPERRKTMARAGQQRARETFSAEVIVSLYEKLYERAYNGPRRS
jgi:N-acetyl-alpha-D-glucosaminyl L-malate synthase BshA